MFQDRSPLSPEIWLRDLFACKAVQQGQVVRRKLRDIERYVGLERFLQELESRGFRAVENRGQVVIFCNRAPVRRLI
ncbi:MAG: aspartate aminotransferase [Pseudodonghicola sp.]